MAKLCSFLYLLFIIIAYDAQVYNFAEAAYRRL